MVIIFRKLRKNNLNFISKIFFTNLRLSFVLKMSLIFGKISASCPYKLCPHSIKRVYMYTYESHFIKKYKPSLNESKLWFNKKDIQIPYIFAISPQMALQQMKLDSNRIQQTMWLMINLRSFSFFPALVSLQIMSKKMLFSMELSNCVLSVI